MVNDSTEINDLSPWKVRAREDELQFHLKHENVVVGVSGSSFWQSKKKITKKEFISELSFKRR